VAKLFSEFETFSGLRLNLQKSVVVPLHLCDLTRVHDSIARKIAWMAGIKVAMHAKYLGFHLGPGRQAHTYDKPLQKYATRAAEWGQTGAGLHLTTVAYAVYILPVVLFVAQLDAPPEAWAATEATALRRLLPGPGCWVQPADVRGLKNSGMPKGIPDLAHIITATQFRVASREAAATGGLKVGIRASLLRQWLSTSEQVSRCGVWHQWFQRAFLLQLDAAVTKCRGRGITQESVVQQLSNHAARPFTREVQARIDSGFPRATRAALRPSLDGGLQERMRHKLERWRTPQFPRVRATRAIRVLQMLAKLVPPRVVAALLRTLWNGWTTERRMQRAVHDGKGCIFGCEAADSIEHYASCSTVASFARRSLRLPHMPTPPEQLADFLILDVSNPEANKALLTRKALRVAAVYHVHNWRRHYTGSDPAMTTEALLQALRAAVAGHPVAVRALAATWEQ
jgi:hypothetical protein